jgi:hypothetical protein
MATGITNEHYFFYATERGNNTCIWEHYKEEKKLQNQGILVEPGLDAINVSCLDPF